MSTDPIALSRVTELAKLIVDEERRLYDLEMALDVQKKLVSRIKREDMPELMQELGLSYLGLDDGSVVEISPGVNTSITDETRTGAIGWLEEHGFSGLIKTQVTVAFARDQREVAVEFYDKVRQEVPATLQETVHPQTLKAFVKEQIDKGECPPKDLFHIYQYKEAKVKLPRNR
jgi:hypothetical protein